jgi:anti-anti-sigma factor
MLNNDIVPGFDDEQDETLKIHLQSVPGSENCLVLVLNGYIDTYNSNHFLKRIQRVIDSGYIRLIFQCGGLNYVSSTGIGSFTTFLKTIKPKGGDLILLEVQPKVYEVFQILGFSKFFNMQDSLDESIAFFQNEVVVTEETAIFPKVFACPVCFKKLRALKPGRFRCSECKSVLEITDDGEISPG